MKSQLQKTIAIGVMLLGAAVGLWVSSPAGPAAFAQSDGGLPIPPPDNSLPPSMDLPPPSDPGLPPTGGLPPPSNNQLPPPDMGFPGPPSDMPLPNGNAVPPDMPPGDGSIPQMSGDGLQMQAPEALTQRNVNPEGFIYNPDGLRDPFYPTRKGREEIVTNQPEIRPPNEVDFNPQDPLQAFTLVEYRLVAVMWEVREPRAMVQTPDGKVFVIRRKIRLGREGAVVAAIRESEIVVVEPNPDGTYVNATTRVIPMRK